MRTDAVSHMHQVCNRIMCSVALLSRMQSLSTVCLLSTQIVSCHPCAQVYTCVQRLGEASGRLQGVSVCTWRRSCH